MIFSSMSVVPNTTNSRRGTMLSSTYLLTVVDHIVDQALTAHQGSQRNGRRTCYRPCNISQDHTTVSF